MTPAARVQAAIELIDGIALAARDAGPAADTLIARYFKERRYAGSKDRRAVRDLVYDVVRSIGERPVSGRAALVGYARERAPELLELFGAGEHAPAALAMDEAGASPSLAPAWLATRLERRFGGDIEQELEALLGRAPLDLRVNRLKATRDELSSSLPGVVPTKIAPDGLRAAEPFAIEVNPAFLDGRVEVQDEGSQLVGIAAGAEPGMTVVDLCAGAGGKTLALAAAMRNQGRIIACDTDRARLSRLAPRADRAGATIIETVLLDPGREAGQLEYLLGQADVVLVDAPCSGTGTWRRNPEARWRLTPARLERLAALQARLLDLAATLVAPSGVLVYAVCSLLCEEGEDQACGFLARHEGWLPSPLMLPLGSGAMTQTVLTPAKHGTDGFFIARFAPIC